MAHPNPATARRNNALAAGALERETEVIRLRSTGLSNKAVADELGISEATASSLFWRAIRRRREQNSDDVADLVEAKVAEYQAIQVQFATVAMDPKTPLAHRLKALNGASAQVDRIAKLLGLYAPEQHRHLHGHVDPGIDIPVDVLEAMSDDELAAQIDAQRVLRQVPDDDGEDDDAADDADDGLPPEVVIEDPGPRALAPPPPEAEPDGE